VYRVEAYIDFLGKPRGWNFSNPIYATPKHEPEGLDCRHLKLGGDPHHVHPILLIGVPMRVWAGEPMLQLI
jgi:hypothetical protein